MQHITFPKINYTTPASAQFFLVDLFKGTQRRAPLDQRILKTNRSGWPSLVFGGLELQLQRLQPCRPFLRIGRPDYYSLNLQLALAVCKQKNSIEFASARMQAARFVLEQQCVVENLRGRGRRVQHGRAVGAVHKHLEEVQARANRKAACCMRGGECTTMRTFLRRMSVEPTPSTPDAEVRITEPRSCVCISMRQNDNACARTHMISI